MVDFEGQFFTSTRRPEGLFFPAPVICAVTLAQGRQNGTKSWEHPDRLVSSPALTPTSCVTLRMTSEAGRATQEPRSLRDGPSPLQPWHRSCPKAAALRMADSHQRGKGAAASLSSEGSGGNSRCRAPVSFGGGTATRAARGVGVRVLAGSGLRSAAGPCPPSAGGRRADAGSPGREHGAGRASDRPARRGAWASAWGASGSGAAPPSTWTPSPPGAAVWARAAHTPQGRLPVGPARSTRSPPVRPALTLDIHAGPAIASLSPRRQRCRSAQPRRPRRATPPRSPAPEPARWGTRRLRRPIAGLVSR